MSRRVVIVRPKHRRPTPPGVMLREEFLKPRHLTQAALAARMGVAPRIVSAIVAGTKPIDCATAVLLAKALGTSRGFWIGLQTQNDAWRAAATLEDSPRFLGRVRAARASLRAGRGARLEDL